MNHKEHSFVAACVAALLAVSVFAAEPVKRKVVFEVAYDPAAPDMKTKLVPAFKFAKAYEAHPFVFQKKRQAGLSDPQYTVLGPDGKTVYAGGECTAAEEAAVNQLTDLPIPGSLCPVMPLVKFKADRKKLEWLGKPMEGFALSAYKAALKSPKPAVADEAKMILDALEKRKAQLEAEIADELTDDKPAALRDMRFCVATWPSTKEKYAEKIAELSADPAIKAAADKLVKAIKRK